MLRTQESRYPVLVCADQASSYQDIGLSRISLCPGKAQAISSLMIFTKPDGGGDQVNLVKCVRQGEIASGTGKMRSVGYRG